MKDKKPVWCGVWPLTQTASKVNVWSGASCLSLLLEEHRLFHWHYSCCSKPSAVWAVYNLSRTICSSPAALFMLTTLSQQISTLNHENVSTDYFPSLPAVAEDELVWPPLLLAVSAWLACCTLLLARPTCSAEILGCWPHIGSLKIFLIEWSSPRCSEG